MAIRKTIMSAVLVLMGSHAVSASDLSKETEISEGLIAAGLAIELARVCDDLDVRMVRGALFLRGLEQRASQMGYSDAEIDEYIDDSAEKARLESVARARLAQMGAVTSDPSTYCAIGRSEISKDTVVGRLLR